MEIQENEDVEKGTKVNAVLAHTTPYRLIFYHSDEEWSPSVEDINEKKYDHTKLHRLSGSIDIGLPDPLCLHLGFDGSLLLPLTKDFWPVDKSVTAFNKILGKLALGGIYFNALEPTDIDQAILHDTGYFRPLGLATSFVGKIRLSVQQKLADAYHSISLLHDPSHILFSELKSAFAEGDSICSQISSLSPEFIVNGTSAFVTHNWGEALTNFWIVAEQVLDNLWNEHVIEGKPHPEPDIPNRRNFLESRAWNASNQVEMLFQKEILPRNTYQLLSDAKAARNKLVHGGELPDRSEAESAFEGAFQLIACKTHPNDINYFSEQIEKFKDLDPIERHYSSHDSISSEEIDFSLGPLPPIPGEETWGDEPYESPYDLEDKYSEE